MFLARILVIAFNGFMIFTVASNCIGNIRQLRPDVRNISRDLVEIRQGLIRKIWMFAGFATFSTLYFGFIIGEHVYLMLIGATNRQQNFADGIESLACMAMYGVVLALFHPCFFTASFRLGQIQDVQVVNAPSAPFHKATLLAGALAAAAVGTLVPKEALGKTMVVQYPGNLCDECKDGV
ncbi:MAG: hypothetical protein P4M11_10135 [Candidatus Pacebacteria bacterium]|nr:hypothetical protein [Candidatus Paceibacterota bacterium]